MGTALLVVLLAAPATAEVWRYTDERGGIHFTDNPGRVPDRFQDSLAEVEVPVRPGETEAEREARSQRRKKEKGEGNSVSRRFLEIARGGSMTPRREAEFEMMEEWLNTWGLAYMIAGIPWMVITLVSGIHSLRHRRWLWALGHALAWPIAIPLYLLMRFDAVPVGARVAMLVVWTSPFVVGGLALRALFVQFSQQGLM